MCTYLHGPRDGGIYYFRRGIPQPLRRIIGKREFLISLRVKDREQAKRLIPGLTTKTQAILDEAAARVNQTQPSSTHRAAEDDQWLHDREGEDYLSRIAWEEDEAAIAREPLVAALEDRLKLPMAELTPEEQAAKDIIDHLTFELKLSKESQRFVAADKKANTKLIEPKASPPSISNVGHGVPNTSISAMYESYAEQPGLRPATVRQFRSIINHLIKFLEHDIANQVSTKSLIRWRQFLQREVLPNGEPRSAKTINTSYLAAANVTFAYGVNELLIPTNPMAAVGKVRAEKKIKLRDPDFSRAERKTILSATLNLSDSRRSPHLSAALRWVPWLCAYTGARVNEMTQLQKQDVSNIDGVWALKITPASGDVKTDEARLVPVHEHLIEQGFIEYIDNCPNGPLFYNPDKSGVGLQRGQYKRVGMRLAEWVRGLGIGQIGDRSLQPNHAWRHTFKTLCLEAGIEERAMDYMQGHSSKGVGRTYGSNTLPMLQAQLAKFPRYELS